MGQVKIRVRCSKRGLYAAGNAARKLWDGFDIYRLGVRIAWRETFEDAMQTALEYAFRYSEDVRK